jgi:hypothetical protein
MREEESKNRRDELADLAALADGSLSRERRAEVERRIAASAELRALLEEQKRALAAVRREDRAPERLRARIESRRVRSSRRRRLRLAAGACASAAALALALILSGGAGEQPSIAEAAGLAARPATAPGPGPYDETTTLLALEVDGIPYPNWSHRFGWRATGARTDRIDGREASTVFYEKHGRRIGYTILSGPALRVPAAGARVTRRGTELRGLDLGARAVVTWRRRGHTCVLSGTAVERTTLLTLGAWKGGGSIPY